MRAEAISLRPEFIHGPYNDALGFGNAIMVRTCWGEDDGWPNEFNAMKLYKGVWAGHRFDITIWGRHKEEVRQEEWKDASDEVAKDIATTYEALGGSDWRKDMIESARRF